MYIYIYTYIYIFIYIYIHIGKTSKSIKYTPTKILFVPPDALKIQIHSLFLPALGGFFCKKFSKLLKFTLQNTLFLFT